MNNRKQIISRSLVSIGILVVFCLLMLWAYRALGLQNIAKSPEALKEWILAQGFNSKIIYIGIQFLQVTFLPIPNVITIVAGAMIFGPWNAFWMSFVGTIIGSLLAFAIGKYLGVPVVTWICGKENVEKFSTILKKRHNVVIFLLFLLPWFPDDVIAMIAGLTPMKWKDFTLAVIIARPWSMLATAYLMGGQLIPFTGWGIAVWIIIGIIIVLMFIIIIKYPQKVLKAIDKIADKFERRKKRQEKKPLSSADQV